MKKIFLFFAAACMLFACDPEQEKISNGGEITTQQLESQSSVTLDKSADGKDGNVVTCTTSAPVNAKWIIDGKDFLGNYATKKLKLGDHNIQLVGLNPNGKADTISYKVTCQVITNALNKYWIYGEDPATQPPFKPGSWDAAQMRFSDNEGKHLPYLTDEIYWGFKTLVLDIADVEDGTNCKIMTGWWSPVFYEDFDVKEAIGKKSEGLWEIPITEEIAKACARGNNGEGRDLDLMLKSGNFTLKGIYYEE